MRSTLRILAVAGVFSLHLNISDGTTVFALDLVRKRFVRPSPNWATPFPLPGESAFLTLTENRYIPIPGSKKTANCWYIEHWDEMLTTFGTLAKIQPRFATDFRCTVGVKIPL